MLKLVSLHRSKHEECEIAKSHLNLINVKESGMISDRDTAISMREHMANILWLLTASATKSPLTECPEDERREYNLAIAEVCELIYSKVIQPIESKHTGLPELKHVRHEEFKRKKL